MNAKMYECAPDHEYTATRNAERPGMTGEVANTPCPPPLAQSLHEIEGIQVITLEKLDAILRFLGEEKPCDTAARQEVKNFGDALRAASFWANVIADKAHRVGALLGVEM